MLTASDLVALTGGTRAAATLSVVADPSTIDAGIDIIHPETGTVDTVHPETGTVDTVHLSPE